MTFPTEMWVTIVAMYYEHFVKVDKEGKPISEKGAGKGKLFLPSVAISELKRKIANTNKANGTNYQIKNNMLVIADIMTHVRGGMSKKNKNLITNNSEALRQLRPVVNLLSKNYIKAVVITMDLPGGMETTGFDPSVESKEPTSRLRYKEPNPHKGVYYWNVEDRDGTMRNSPFLLGSDAFPFGDINEVFGDQALKAHWYIFLLRFLMEKFTIPEGKFIIIYGIPVWSDNDIGGNKASFKPVILRSKTKKDDNTDNKAINVAYNMDNEDLKHPAREGDITCFHFLNGNMDPQKTMEDNILAVMSGDGDTFLTLVGTWWRIKWIYRGGNWDKLSLYWFRPVKGNPDTPNMIDAKQIIESTEEGFKKILYPIDQEDVLFFVFIFTALNKNDYVRPTKGVSHQAIFDGYFRWRESIKPHRKLFCVTKDYETMKVDVVFDMECWMEFIFYVIQKKYHSVNKMCLKPEHLPTLVKCVVEGGVDTDLSVDCLMALAGQVRFSILYFSNALLPGCPVESCLTLDKDGKSKYGFERRGGLVSYVK